MSVLQLTGQICGRWTVIERAPNDKFRNSMWKCVCTCGNFGIIKGSHLKWGFTKSCGCYAKEAASARARHGMSKYREFKVWGAMIQRCCNKRHRQYPSYGGRGITVCESWKDFVNFFADMGRCPKGLTLERRDNNAGYSPSNCYWADRFAQNSNTRRSRLITLAGRTQNVYRWSKELGVGPAALYRWAKLGKLERYEKLASAL